MLRHPAAKIEPRRGAAGMPLRSIKLPRAAPLRMYMIKVIGGFMIQALNLYSQSDLFFVF
ncbi:Hypothetical protein PMN2A_2174 [Prochlorococcus marinus str. NATL2A]|uniref:Uncharacterized protein n=1 Tax=Prochlorococcus marinus (strain NATL2A) TaxID=59920 RepID=A7ME05_PROMT|nr:Hypothetical protein PMN2A_2174 [Prochlorococcus marinus str. NATL2A]